MITITKEQVRKSPRMSLYSSVFSMPENTWFTPADVQGHMIERGFTPQSIYDIRFGCKEWAERRMLRKVNDLFCLVPYEHWHHR